MPDVKNAFIFFIRPSVRTRQGKAKNVPSYQKPKKKKIETHGWLSTTVSILKRAIVIAPRNVIENMHIRGIHLRSYVVVFLLAAVAYGNGIRIF